MGDEIRLAGILNPLKCKIALFRAVLILEANRDGIC